MKDAWPSPICLFYILQEEEEEETAFQECLTDVAIWRQISSSSNFTQVQFTV